MIRPLSPRNSSGVTSAAIMRSTALSCASLSDRRWRSSGISGASSPLSRITRQTVLAPRPTCVAISAMLRPSRRWSRTCRIRRWRWGCRVMRASCGERGSVAWVRTPSNSGSENPLDFGMIRSLYLSATPISVAGKARIFPRMAGLCLCFLRIPGASQKHYASVIQT